MLTLWPQLILLVLMGIDLGIALVLHGKPRANYNFWLALVDAVTLLLLLSQGGFFKFFPN